MAVCMIPNCRKKCPGDEPFCAEHRKKNENPERAALHNLIRAWEELPGGQHYSTRKIEYWLVHQMSPAINRARKVLT